MLTLAGNTPRNSAMAASAPTLRVRGAISSAPAATSATPGGVGVEAGAARQFGRHDGVERLGRHEMQDAHAHQQGAHPDGAARDWLSTADLRMRGCHGYIVACPTPVPIGGYSWPKVGCAGGWRRSTENLTSRHDADLVDVLNIPEKFVSPSRRIFQRVLCALGALFAAVLIVYLDRHGYRDIERRPNAE